MINYRKPTSIKGLSEQRRLPRLGKIRLGIKKVSQKSGKEYPAETSYFVVPPEVVKVYGETPTELDVMIPVEDLSVIIPQAYEMYGSGKGLKCVGDGEIAYRHDDKTQDMKEIDCPCEHLGHDCKQRAHLRVILPKINVGGIYEITTSSFNSIIDLNSSVDYIRALIGRIALVPLKLKRVPTETHHDGKKQIHYTLRLELEADINFVNQLRENTARILLQAAQYSLPPPLAENPAMDDGTIVEVVENMLNVPENVPGNHVTKYIAEVIFPKLKQLGKKTKAEAEIILSEWSKGKFTTFEALDYTSAEELFCFLQEQFEKTTGENR